MKIVLASASPRRQELLKIITDDFEIMPSNAEEIIPENLTVEQIPVFLAELKAKSVMKNLVGDAVVIGCDTVVAVDNTALGKPKDADDAFRMLKMLSGREHSVITGCCIARGGEIKSFGVETKVEFYDLSDKEISDYIETGEPFDKAGAYGIQGLGSLLVKRIDGDFFNVVGLPVSRLCRELKLFIENQPEK